MSNPYLMEVPQPKARGNVVTLHLPDGDLVIQIPDDWLDDSEKLSASIASLVAERLT